MPTRPTKKFLTIHETASYVGAHEGHVRKACLAGRLPGAYRRGKSWRIPEESAGIWFLLPRPVGRPPKPAPVIPPDVSQAELSELCANAETYEEWWAIVEQNAPRLASRLHVTSPVKTDAELAHESWSSVPLEVADRARFPDPRRHKHPSAFRNRLHAHFGEGPTRLSEKQVRALLSDVQAARREYLADTAEQLRQLRAQWL
jgi:excisionase family DNA binding protein